MGKKISLLLALVWILTTKACITRDQIPVFDFSRGQAEQEEIIKKYFGEVDLQADPKAFSDFKNGKRKAVSAAWFGFAKQDSTSFLQAALDCGAEVVLIPNLGEPWICETLNLRSNTCLVLEKGVEIIAKRGAFQKVGDFLFRLVDVQNISIYGYGARIKMWKEDYQKPPYKKSEWRHALALYGTNNIKIAGLVIENSGGDGIYLGRGKATVNTDIVLTDLILKDHHRQAISVISAKNLLIQNCELAKTSGTAPQAGIDFEPNRPDEVLINCKLKNCIIYGNSGAGFLAALEFLNDKSLPIEITLEDCYIFNNLCSICILGSDKGAQGKITFINCKIYGIILTPSLPADKIILSYK